MTPSTNVATLPSGCSFTQAFAGEHRKGTWDDWVGHPDVTEHAYNEIGTRTRLDAGRETVDVTGRLIGICIETICNLAGKPDADVGRFASERAPEG